VVGLRRRLIDLTQLDGTGAEPRNRDERSHQVTTGWSIENPRFTRCSSWIK
jgi:hypothetical protein